MAILKLHGWSGTDSFSYGSSMQSYELRTLGGDDLVVDRSLADSFIFTGGGDDMIFDYAGNDVLNAGKGRDHIYVEATQTSHHVTIFGGTGSDALVVEAGPMSKSHTEHGVEFVETTNGSVIEVHGVENIFVI